MKVRITRDTCSPLWVVRCAEPCSACRIHTDLTAPKPVCWLSSGLSRPHVIGLCITRGWIIQGDAATPRARTETKLRARSDGAAVEEYARRRPRVGHERGNE